MLILRIRIRNTRFKLSMVRLFSFGSKSLNPGKINVPSMPFVRMASPRSIFSSPLRPEPQQASASQVTPTKNILFREGLPQPVLFLSEHIVGIIDKRTGFESLFFVFAFPFGGTLKIHRRKPSARITRGGFEQAALVRGFTLK
jgi:hypothetical protein